jgi:hypothetical protein
MEQEEVSLIKEAEVEKIPKPLTFRIGDTGMGHQERQESSLPKRIKKRINGSFYIDHQRPSGAYRPNLPPE